MEVEARPLPAMQDDVLDRTVQEGAEPLCSVPHKRPENPAMSADQQHDQEGGLASPSKRQKLEEGEKAMGTEATKAPNDAKPSEGGDQAEEEKIVEEKPWNICDGDCGGCLEFLGETRKRCLNCGCMLINHIPVSNEDFPCQDDDDDYLPEYGNEEDPWY